MSTRTEWAVRYEQHKPPVQSLIHYYPVESKEMALLVVEDGYPYDARNHTVVCREVTDWEAA